MPTACLQLSQIVNEQRARSSRNYIDAHYRPFIPDRWPDFRFSFPGGKAAERPSKSKIRPYAANE
jgi:hypothetical protein